MKISDDKKADALSIELQEGRMSKDVEIAKNVFAGFDRDGNLLRRFLPRSNASFLFLSINFQTLNHGGWELGVRFQKS